MADNAGLPLVNAESNAVETIPWDQAHEALTKGSHNLQAGQSVNVVNPDGSLVSLPAEQVPEALQSGYRIPGQEQVTEHENQKKYGEGFGNEAKAAAAALARTASFGASDVALTHPLSPLGPSLVDPNTLKQLEERNTVGDIAGTIGAFALPFDSAVTAVGKLGEAVTEAAGPMAAKIAASLANPETSPIVAKILASVGETGAKTLGSAVEGAVYGAGNAVTEHALGDPDANGENLLHNVGYGALFGGGMGSVLGITGETYKALKGTFGKDIANAATKDAIIENAALHPTPQMIEPPTSLEEIERHIANAAKEGYGEELPAKGRLLETNDILAGESQYPAHSLQVQSLTSPLLRDSYKVALENPQSVDGQTLRTYEAVQKREASDKLLPKFIQDIAPEEKLISDPVEAGNHAVNTFVKQYNTEKETLSPFFKEFDKKAINLSADPTAVLTTIDKSLPEAAQYIVKDPEGYSIAKYSPKMPFSKDTHEAIKSLLDTLNDPAGVTIADLRNVRESLRDKVNFLSAPRVSREISGLRRSIMDLMQDEVDKLAPGEAVEGLNHPLKSPLTDTRELFKRYAQNEEKRAIIEQIMGGSISDKASFAREIKPEEVLNRLFGNTISVKAAKEILGADFNKIAANYIKQKVGGVTDVTKNGFSSNKFATFLKQKAPELEEALAQNPDQLNKIRAVTDKMRILPDSPSINPSGTAKATLLQKMQNLGGYLGKDGITSIPGKVLGALGEAYDEMKQHSEFNRILRSGSNANSEEQLVNKTRQYGALSKIERMQQATANTISKGAKALFTVGDKTKVVLSQKLIPKEEQQKKYDKLQTHLKEMTGNPELFIDALSKSTQDLQAIAPDINGSLNNAAVRATQFLRSKLPAQDPSSTLTAPYKPSGTELAIFNRYVHAVNHPLDILKELKNGTITKESLETVQTVYPKLVGQIQKAISDNLNEKNVAKMPYQQKLMISAFLGMDISNTLHQQNIASAQISSAPPPVPSEAQTVKPSQKGLGHLKQSNQLLTPQQASNQRSDR